MSQEFPAASSYITENAQPLFRHTATKALCDQCCTVHLWCWTPVNNIKNPNGRLCRDDQLAVYIIYLFHFSPKSGASPLMTQQSTLEKTVSMMYKVMMTRVVTVHPTEWLSLIHI